MPARRIGLVVFRKDRRHGQRRRKQRADVAPRRASMRLVAFGCGGFLPVERWSPWAWKRQFKLPGHAATDAQ